MTTTGSGPTASAIPVPVCDVRIVADAGADGGVDAPPGGVGEIWIRGPNVVPGYWHREEETAATFTDGWLHTGDIGRVDDEGFLYILDRAKDIIIRGGENIASIEVEAALYEDPRVAEAAVFASPHPTLGEEVAAVVRLWPGMEADADELRARVAEQIAPFKVPYADLVRHRPVPAQRGRQDAQARAQGPLRADARSVGRPVLT